MTLTARQRRILINLALGDLLWEIPHQDCFAQYNERTGRQMHVHVNVLEKMAELGLVRLVTQGAHRLNYWSITLEGQKFVANLEPVRKSPSLIRNNQPIHTTKRSA